MAQSKSYMYGAVILLVANLLVKGIGALFKIPLTYILGNTVWDCFQQRIRYIHGFL